MFKKDPNFLTVGFLLLAISVSLGAFGAHALKNMISPQMMENWQTAIQYMNIHSLCLCLGAHLLTQNKLSPWSKFGLYSYLAGIILFSGFLILYVMTNVKTFAMVVPLGGVSFILGHLAMAMATLSPKN